MNTETLYRVSGCAVLVGATVGAGTTALELVTSPYNLYGTVVWLNPWVHLAKYCAMILLLLGLPAVYLRQRERAGTVGLVGLVVLCLGLAFAATPYNVVEWSLDPALSQQEAAMALDTIYATTPIWTILGMLGMLAVLLGLLLVGIATLRARILPRWTAMLSLASIGVGIGSIVLMGTLPGLVPHPPVWLLLGLIGYGYALIARTRAARATSVAASPATELVPAEH